LILSHSSEETIITASQVISASAIKASLPVDSCCDFDFVSLLSFRRRCCMCSMSDDVSM
jgi:hypothetical protein